VWAGELELEQVGNLSTVYFSARVHRLYIHVTLESIFPAFCLAFPQIVRAKNSWHIHGRGSVSGGFYRGSLPGLPARQLTWRSLKCQMFSGTIHPFRSSVPTYDVPIPFELLMEIALGGGVWRRLPVVLCLEKFMLKGCQFDLGTSCAFSPRCLAI